MLSKCISPNKLDKKRINGPSNNLNRPLSPHPTPTTNPPNHCEKGGYSKTSDVGQQAMRLLLRGRCNKSKL